MVPSPLQPEQHSFGGPSTRAGGKKGLTGISRGLSKELPHMPEGCRQTTWLLQGPKWGTRLGEQLCPALTTPAYEDGRRAPGTLALSTDTLAPDLL